MEKRKLRMIHNMARSGSTLMYKCVGCMDGVVLLGELHLRANRPDEPGLKNKFLANPDYRKVYELLEYGLVE
jgi:hypothetical protein